LKEQLASLEMSVSRLEEMAEEKRAEEAEEE
jgi:hypothetical protein